MTFICSYVNFFLFVDLGNLLFLNNCNNDLG